jgi:hypothetical protein
VIWEPFVLALVLGIIVSAGLYFAYLWPSVEPLDDDATAADVADGRAGAAALADDPTAASTVTDDAASAP